MADDGQNSENDIPKAVMSYGKRSSHARRLAIIVLVAVLLLAAGVVAAIWLSRDKQTTGQKAGQLTEELQNLRLSGKNSEAEKRINSALKSSGLSSDERYALYSQQGGLLMDSKRYTEAAGAYEKAAAAKNDSNVQSLIGDAWRMAGDNAKAISAYRQAKALMPDSPMSEQDKEALQLNIDLLSENL